MAKNQDCHERFRERIFESENKLLLSLEGVAWYRLVVSLPNRMQLSTNCKIFQEHGDSLQSADTLFLNSSLNPRSKVLLEKSLS
jgi:hypothetical protein